MSEGQSNSFLFLVDDGWRQEKAVILRELHKELPFDIITHDPLTVEALSDLTKVTLLTRHPIPRTPQYLIRRFLSKDLDTNLVAYRERVKRNQAPLPVRMALKFRELLARLGLRKGTVVEVLEKVYQGSNCYEDALNGYHTLVFMPTSIKDKRVVFEAKTAGLQLCYWIYSWDNAFKDNEFLLDADRYLVWNEPIREMMKDIHHLPEARIGIVPPLQLDVLRNRSFPAKQEPDPPVVLYACAFGLPAHAAQEEDMVLHIREVLDRVNPEAVLQVRPYPFRLNLDTYHRLREHPRVDLLEFGTVKNNNVVLNDAEAEERILQIHRATLFINFASTITLEASYTSTPILQLGYHLPADVPEWLNHNQALKNEHLIFLKPEGYPNIVTSPDAMEQAFRDLLAGHQEDYLPYSVKLREFTDPMNRSEHVSTLRDELQLMTPASS